MPVYLVKSPTGDRLVEAAQKSTAINHVIRNTITAEPVSASELVKLMADNMKVEQATVEKTVDSKDLPAAANTAGE